MTNKRNAIIVLGMHRSGTSALMRIINICGVDLGTNLMPPIKNNNERGFWEHLGFYHKNEKLLQDLNSSWDDVVSLPKNWWNYDCAQRYKLEISSLISHEFSKSSFWGLKDPRLCRLLPVWVPILEMTGNKPHFIIIVRNPLEVASSLSKRDDFSMGKSCLMWLIHLIEAEKGTRRTSRMFTTYKELLTDWKKVLDRAEKELNIRWPVRPLDVASQVEEYFTEDLYHNRIQDTVVIKDKNLSSWVREAYGSLQATEDGKYSKLIRTLKRIDAKYKEVANLYEPVIKELSESLDTNKKLLVEQNKNISAINKQLTELHSNKGYQTSQVESLQKTIIVRDELIKKNNLELGKLRQESIRFGTRIKENEEKIQNLTIDLENTRKKLSKTEDAASLHQIQKKKLEDIVEEMKASIDANKEKINDLMMLNEKLQTNYDLAQKKIMTYQNELNSFLNSTSWKITGPLRKMSTTYSKLLQKSKASRFKVSKE